MLIQIGGTLGFNTPVLSRWVLDRNHLCLWFSDNGFELQFLDIFLRLLNALADQVNEDRFALLNSAFHLHEPDIIIDHIGMERDIQIQVIVRRQEALIRRNREEFMAEPRVPVEMATNITQIGQLDGPGELGIHHYGAKTDCGFQKLQFHAMGTTTDLQERPDFLVLHDLELQVLREFVQTGLRPETELNIVFITRRNHDILQRIERNEEFVQGLDLIITIQRNTDGFLGEINQTDRFGHIATDSLDAKVHVLVFRFFEFKLQRHAFTFDSDIH